MATNEVIDNTLNLLIRQERANKSIDELLAKKHDLMNIKKRIYENQEIQILNEIKRKAYFRIIADIIIVALFIGWIWHLYTLNK